MQLQQSYTGMCGQENLVQFFSNAFSADNLQSLSIAAKGIFCLLLNIKAQLRGETHTTKHTQRIIREGDIRIQRCTNQSIFQVVYTIKRVHQFTETIVIQADGQGIDGEIAAALIIFQSTIFHHRLARVVAIAFLTCTYELHFIFLPRSSVLRPHELYLRGAEILEDTQMCFLSKFFL